MARIAPVPRAEWPPELAEFIAGFRSAVRENRSEDQRQSGGNLLGTLAAHPALTQAFLTFNGHLLYGSTLTPRQRELLILRVAALRGCGYEWAQHVLMGLSAGLERAEIDQIPDGPDTGDWSSAEQTLLKAADDLLVDGVVGAETWKLLTDEFDERQIMDVVFTVGTYEMLAKALRTFEVEAEPALVPYLPTF